MMNSDIANTYFMITGLKRQGNTLQISEGTLYALLPYCSFTADVTGTFIHLAIFPSVTLRSERKFNQKC